MIYTPLRTSSPSNLSRVIFICFDWLANRLLIGTTPFCSQSKIQIRTKTDYFPFEKKSITNILVYLLILDFRLIPVDKIPRPTLRWDVFFVDKKHGSNSDNDNNHRNKNLSKAEIAAICMSAGAVVFAVIGFIIAVTRNHQRRDYMAVS